MIETVGFDAICAFSRTFSGTSVYIPSLRTIFSQCLEKDMLCHYNGTNVKDLARKYGFSERYVRSLVNKAG